MFVDSRQGVRSFQQFTVALAHANPFQRDHGPPEQPAEFRQHPTDALAGPDGNVLVCGSLYLVGEILALSA